MKKYILLLIFTICTPAFAASEDELIKNAEEVYEATKIVCSGISDEIGRIANISTVNTVITGAGTAAATGALVTGIKKSAEEEEIEKLIQDMCDKGGCDAETIDKMSDEDFFNTVIKNFSKIADLRDKNNKSKKLGNWRTGLMAGTIGTNLASAIISGRNTDQSELIQQITACNDMTKAISNVGHELKTAGITAINSPIAKKLDNIKTWCNQIDVADIEKIENRMKGVLGTSIAGGAIGVAGTATSAIANSDKYTDLNNKNSYLESERKKEKKLNTATNIMAGANIATGAAGTVLNVSLITLAKKLIKNAQRCEEILQ
jgi:hypothetical protein